MDLSGRARGERDQRGLALILIMVELDERVLALFVIKSICPVG